MLPVLFQIGSFTLHTYGVLLAIGVLIALLLARREARRESMDPHLATDLAFYLLIGALAGSRLFYVLTHLGEFREDPVDALRFWQGGLVFYGGLLLAFAAGLWFVRKHRLNFGAIADWIAPSVAIGQAVGRLGCFAAG